jgi:tetratricopeptide (TPR) repeat protein
MAEAQKTSNPIRLLMLSFEIRKALDAALEADPEDVQVRLDLVRFHTVTPAIAGGDSDAAALHAAEIARRDTALGTFARGYIAYRDKQYGPARRELREAKRLARDEQTKALATKWLGWLSQETQQWADAFASFEELRATDASALYEIGRTAAFCQCELVRGEAALIEYLSVKRGPDMPTADQARAQLKTLRSSADRRRAPSRR